MDASSAVSPLPLLSIVISFAVLTQFCPTSRLIPGRATVTELLVGLFSGNSAAKAMFRRLGLLALDVLPPVRRRFASNAMGLGLF